MADPEQVSKMEGITPAPPSPQAQQLLSPPLPSQPFHTLPLLSPYLRLAQESPAS